jgi:hypothetical protein
VSETPQLGGGEALLVVGPQQPEYMLNYRQSTICLEGGPHPVDDQLRAALPSLRELVIRSPVVGLMQRERLPGSPSSTGTLGKPSRCGRWRPRRGRARDLPSIGPCGHASGGERSSPAGTVELSPASTSRGVCRAGGGVSARGPHAPPRPCLRCAGRSSASAASSCRPRCRGARAATPARARGRAAPWEARGPSDPWEGRVTELRWRQGRSWR